jgi:hypothetical protein
MSFKVESNPYPDHYHVYWKANQFDNEISVIGYRHKKAENDQQNDKVKIFINNKLFKEFDRNTKLDNSENNEELQNLGAFKYIRRHGFSLEINGHLLDFPSKKFAVEQFGKNIKTNLDHDRCKNGCYHGLDDKLKNS